MKTFKLVALGYLIKTAIFVAAWAVIPDLPERTVETARQVWARVAGTEEKR